MAENTGTWRGVQREWQRLAGGGFGKRPGGQRSVPGKEVGIWCDGEVWRRRPLLMGDGSRGEKKTTQKAADTGGTGDRLKVVITSGRV